MAEDKKEICMKKDKIFFELEPEDFILRIHPKRDKNNKWTGEVVVGIVTSDENPLDDADYSGMLQFTNLISSTVAMMEEDDDFREAVMEYAESELKKQEIVLSNRPTIVRDISSNVIKLNFNTDTDGSA